MRVSACVSVCVSGNLMLFEGDLRVSWEEESQLVRPRRPAAPRLASPDLFWVARVPASTIYQEGTHKDHSIRRR